MPRLLEERSLSLLVSLLWAGSGVLLGYGEAGPANLTEPGKAASPRFALFTLFRFENLMCVGSNGRSGTCYTSKQCLGFGGMANGPCARGFGSCCYVARGCSSNTMVNNTYFVGPDTLRNASGACQFSILKPRPNICQYRLTFEEFILEQPNAQGQCVNDRFSVGGATTSVPPICGNNNNQHIYVHSGYNFAPVTLTITAVEASSIRTWRIIVTQLACGSNYLAPDGCLQYFMSSTGTIWSFNWLPQNQGRHLALQDYSMCMRTESGFCSVCLTQCNTNSKSGSFSLYFILATGSMPTSDMIYAGSNNFMAGTNCPTDFLEVPCGSSGVGPSTTCRAERFCGGTLQPPADAVATMGNTVAAPVCTNKKPFIIRFTTDQVEYVDTMAMPPVRQPDILSSGFCIRYNQQPC